MWAGATFAFNAARPPMCSRQGAELLRANGAGSGWRPRLVATERLADCLEVGSALECDAAHAPHRSQNLFEVIRTIVSRSFVEANILAAKQ